MVEAVDVQPLSSVIVTVNSSPSTKPVTEGFCAVASLNDALPSLLHDQLTASPPVSMRSKEVTSKQTGPLFEAEAVGSALTVTVVVAVEVQPLSSVMVTVNTSPSTKPVADGFCAVASLNDALPSLLHDQLTASPPVSIRSIDETS